METTAEWNIVRNAVAEKVGSDINNQHWYIGLRRIGRTWKWIEEPEGVTQVTVAADDPRWQDGEPSDDFDEPCGEIQSNYRTQRGYFNNVICNEIPEETFHRGYICELEQY